MRTHNRSGGAAQIQQLERRCLLAIYAPDVSFGEGGHADAGGNLILDDLADGRILAVSQRRLPPQGFDDLSFETAASRLNPDGTIDTSFGVNGRIRFPDIYRAAHTGTKLFVAGPGAENVDALHIFAPDGQPDTSFSGDGVGDVPFVTPPAGARSVSVRARMIQATPDGGVLLRVDVDYIDAGEEFVTEFHLVKLSADGSLDDAFGDGGIIVFTTLPPQVAEFHFQWTSLGLLRITHAPTGAELTRFESDGTTIDTGFGDDGTVVLPVPPGAAAAPRPRIVEQPDGKLLIVTSENESAESGGPVTTRISRLNANGSADTAFGSSGSIVLEDQSLTGFALDDQQRIVVATSLSLYRYSPAGVLDAAPFNGTLGPGKVAGELEFDNAGRLLAGGATTVTRFDVGEEVELGRDNVVYVRGSAADDVVTASAAPDDKIDVSLNGEVTQFDAGAVVGFGMLLEEGANSATVGLDLPATVTTGAGADTVTTADGDDSIGAGGGDNVISMGDGDDTVGVGDFTSETDHSQITGGDGDKEVTATHGRITLTLGSGDSNVRSASAGGDDHVTIAGGNNRVFVSNGNDVVEIGGDGDNHVQVVANTFVGAAQVTTGGGDDAFILEGPGTINSGGGNDFIRIDFVPGPLTVFAGDGNDRIIWDRIGIGDGSPATVLGGNGNDYIEAFRGADVLHGNAGHDTIIGGDGSDLLSGGGGHDRLIGGLGKDRLYGGAGFDNLDGGSGDDRLFGHDGRDKLYGGAGNDQLHGGASGDSLYAQRGGDDELFGEGGDDRLYADYANGTQTLHGNGGDDLLVSTDGLTDHLFGDGGHDTAIADDGDARSSIEAIGQLPPPAEPRFRNFDFFGAETTVPLGGRASDYDVAVSANGSYILAALVGDDAGLQSVTAVRYAADGRQLGDPLILETPPAGTFTGGISVSIDADGDAVVAYGLTPPTGGPATVHFRRISSAGVVSGAVLVSEGPVDSPSVSMDDNGGFFIAWVQGWGIDTELSLFARAYDGTGAPLAEPFTVATPDDFQTQSSELTTLAPLEVAAKSDGSGAVITYTETTGGGPLHVRFARLSIAARLGEIGRIDDVASTGFPAVAVYPDGSFVVAYHQLNNGYARRFDPSGFALGGRIELGTSNGDGGGVTGIEVDDLPDGGFVASFHRRIAGNTLSEVLARRYDAAGVPNATEPAIIAAVNDVVIGGIGIGADANGTVVVSYNQFDSSLLRYRRLASDVAAIDNGTLHVLGTESTDAIGVASDVEDLVVTRGSTVRTFDAAQVESLSISGLGGDDTILNDTALPATLVGGIGNDTIRGGSAADTIAGNAGNDRLEGGGGADQLSGNGGRDQLFGGAGDDLLLSAGDSLVDQLFGDDGNDSSAADDIDVLTSVESPS